MSRKIESIKGIGTVFEKNNTIYRYFDSNSIETLAVHHRSQILSQNYEAIVALLRGGTYLATMLSQCTNIPLEILRYDRASCSVSTTLPPSSKRGTKVLLVEDIAGKGYTLKNSKEYLESLGYSVDVFTVCFDNQSRITPDFGIELPNEHLAYFPWERMVQGPTEISRKQNDSSQEVWKKGFDLDGVFFPDLPVEMYEQDLQKTLSIRDNLPPLDTPMQWENGSIIVSARLEEDRDRTVAQLKRINVFPSKLILKQNKKEDPGEFKKRICQEEQLQEFFESEKAQAEKIAKLLSVVTWHYENGNVTRIY